MILRYYRMRVCVLFVNNNLLCLTSQYASFLLDSYNCQLLLIFKYRGVDLIISGHSYRKTIHGLQVNTRCGNMCPNVVNIYY